MASLHFESCNQRPSGYAVVNRESLDRGLAYFPRPVQRPSVISGLKSLFGSKSSLSSSKIQSASADINSSSAPSKFSDRFVSNSRSRGAYEAGGARRESVQIKTSDSFPALSPQLEDRMLQLAERSRRLGVHRYSRARNALLLNEHTSIIPSSTGQKILSSESQSLTKSRFLSTGSSTSMSTQAATPYGGTIQKVPKLQDSRVRE